MKKIQLQNFYRSSICHRNKLSYKHPLFAVVCSEVLAEDKRKQKSLSLQRKKDNRSVTALGLYVENSVQFTVPFMPRLCKWYYLYTIRLRALQTTTPGYSRVKQLKHFGTSIYFSNRNTPKETASQLKHQWIKRKGIIFLFFLCTITKYITHTSCHGPTDQFWTHVTIGTACNHRHCHVESQWAPGCWIVRRLSCARAGELAGMQKQWLEARLPGCATTSEVDFPAVSNCK